MCPASWTDEAGLEQDINDERDGDEQRGPVEATRGRRLERQDRHGQPDRPQAHEHREVDRIAVEAQGFAEPRGGLELKGDERDEIGRTLPIRQVGGKKPRQEDRHEERQPPQRGLPEVEQTQERQCRDGEGQLRQRQDAEDEASQQACRGLDPVAPVEAEQEHHEAQAIIDPFGLKTGRARSTSRGKADRMKVSVALGRSRPKMMQDASSPNPSRISAERGSVRVKKSVL